MLLLVGEACSDPLAPRPLAHLSATSRHILTMLWPKLKELRDFRAEVRALCSKAHRAISPSSLVEAMRFDVYGGGFTLADATVLGRLLRRGALLRLQVLSLSYTDIGTDASQRWCKASIRVRWDSSRSSSSPENRLALLA